MMRKQRSANVVQDLPTTTKAISHGVALAISCTITSEVVLHVYPRIGAISKDNLLLGVMWATVATIFVQRITYTSTLEGALSRMVATAISFALCLLYLLVFQFHIWGLALLVGLGAVVTIAIGRPNEIITTGITTTVIMLVAAMNPEHRWEHPFLRLGDTSIGTVIGAAMGWIEEQFLAFLGDRQLKAKLLGATTPTSSLNAVCSVRTVQGDVDEERVAQSQLEAGTFQEDCDNRSAKSEDGRIRSSEMHIQV